VTTEPTDEAFIRLNVDATQEHEPDLEQITQRLTDRWEASRTAARREVLAAVLDALGRGVSPSYVVADVAEEFDIDLAWGAS
jgi:hypothetical protein